MKNKKVVSSMKWLYHKDCPEGQIFDLDKEDRHKLQDAGWVDTPADFKKAAAPEITKEVAETLSIEDLIAKIKGEGFLVMTGSELEAEINKGKLAAVEEYKEANPVDAPVPLTANERMANYEEVFFKNPTDLTKLELVEYAKLRINKKLTMNMSEANMIKNITEAIDAEQRQ